MGLPTVRLKHFHLSETRMTGAVARYSAAYGVDFQSEYHAFKNAVLAACG